MDAEYGAVAGIAGIALVLFLILLVAVLAAVVIVIIAKWKILTKAGEEGWKAIIPVYGDMVLCKCVGVWEYYPIVLLVISIFSGLFGDSSYLSGTISLLSTAVSIYYGVILNISLAQSFGKDSGFGIGLMLLSIVFYPMLGFGRSQFVGAKPMNDPVINSIFKDHNNTTTQENSTVTPEANVTQETPVQNETTGESTEQVAQGNFCPSCGTANDKDSEFCQKCGNKLN
jgi:hypothetical protein